jgi:UDP-N-acetyl-D-glucosamine dehydrogenase
MNDLNSFLQKHSFKKIIVVQGLGFVGSVMSLVCANAINGDYAVIGVDAPTERGKKITDDLNNGIFPLVAEDPKIDLFFKKSIKNGNFFATTETDAYKFADVIIVDINLDVEKDNHNSGRLINYNVNLSSFKKAISSIGLNCKEDALILVETTVPPGTCVEVVKPVIHNCLKERNLNLDKIKIGHSYERVMPGPDYIDSIQNFYRVYSGVDEKSADAVETFLHTIIRTDEYPLTRLGNTNATEIAKVLENSYRAMNIAFVVEWSRFAEEAGVDLYEVVDAIRLRPTHANLMYPGIGVGGYCLTKDALLASWSRQNLIGKNKPLSQSEKAIEINDQMPRFAFEFLQNNYPDLSSSKLLLLGVSYRGDVGDTRFSPVENLYNYLLEEGASILCHDPYIEYWDEKSIEIIQNLSTHLKNALDIIIISTGHSIYRDDNTLEMIFNLEPLFIYDTIGHLSQKQISKLRKKHTVKVLGRGDL